jgi:hypothetical protein
MNTLKKLEMLLVCSGIGINSSLLMAFEEAPDCYPDIMGCELGAVGNSWNRKEEKDLLIRDDDRKEESVIRLYKRKDKFRIYANMILLKHKYGDSIKGRFREKFVPHSSFIKILNDFKKKEQLSMQNQSANCEATQGNGNENNVQSPPKLWTFCKILEHGASIARYIPSILGTIFDYLLQRQENKNDHAEEMAKLNQGKWAYFCYKVSNLGGGCCSLITKIANKGKSILTDSTGASVVAGGIATLAPLLFKMLL